MSLENEYYYQIAGEASRGNQNHPGTIYLKKVAKKAKSILDVGCGEGSRLNLLTSKKQSSTGTDINSQALILAKKQYPHLKFVLSKSSQIPFPDNQFDLVYSCFVLEHTNKPEKLIEEMIRVLKTGGHLILMCPNFGSPNRRSPNSIEWSWSKLLKGFCRDINFIFNRQIKTLSWRQVKPKDKYQNSDDDTTVEPYLLSLYRYLKGRNLRIIKRSSLWSLETTKHPFKKIIAYLGSKNIYPFKFWGPQIFIVARKFSLKSL